jgi:hypothetical protein
MAGLARHLLATGAAREIVRPMQSRPRLLPVVLATAAFPALFVFRRLLDRFVRLTSLGPGGLGRNLVAEFALLLATICDRGLGGLVAADGAGGPWKQPRWTVLPAIWLALMLLFGLPALLGRLAPLPQVLTLVVASIDVMLPFGMAGLGLLLWEQLNGRNPLVDR